MDYRYVAETNLQHIIDAVERLNGSYTPEYRAHGFVAMIPLHWQDKGATKAASLCITCKGPVGGWSFGIITSNADNILAWDATIAQIRYRLDWLIRNRCVTYLGVRYRVPR